MELDTVRKQILAEGASAGVRARRSVLLRATASASPTTRHPDRRRTIRPCEPGSIGDPRLVRSTIWTTDRHGDVLARDVSVTLWHGRDVGNAYREPGDGADERRVPREGS
jgi:hypothetical protein